MKECTRTLNSLRFALFSNLLVFSSNYNFAFHLHAAPPLPVYMQNTHLFDIILSVVYLCHDHG